MKHLECQVVFSEIPNEVTLAINITNCPYKCEGCHSPYLREDIGFTLSKGTLTNLINVHKGITCVCFMGGDRDPQEVIDIALFIRENFPDLKIGWYSGGDSIPTSIKDNITTLDYIKLGSYQKDRGPINTPTTNQRLYKILPTSLVDITQELWNDNKSKNKREHTPTSS